MQNRSYLHELVQLGVAAGVLDPLQNTHGEIAHGVHAAAWGRITAHMAIDSALTKCEQRPDTTLLHVSSRSPAVFFNHKKHSRCTTAMQPLPVL